MSKQDEKIQITKNIINAAKQYKKFLLGKTFMYCFEDKYIEVSFRKSDFAHLTGVDKKISAKDFYKEAVNGTLRANQIFFSQRYPKDLCKKKLKEIMNLTKLTNSELFLLENISTQTKFYKFGFTELNFTLCVCEDRDIHGIKKSNYFIPQSFRVEDCFDKSTNVYDIKYIFSKSNSEKTYINLEYGEVDKISELNNTIIKNLNIALYTIKAGDNPK